MSFPDETPQPLGAVVYSYPSWQDDYFNAQPFLPLPNPALIQPPFDNPSQLTMNGNVLDGIYDFPLYEEPSPLSLGSPFQRFATPQHAAQFGDRVIHGRYESTSGSSTPLPDVEDSEILSLRNEIQELQHRVRDLDQAARFQDEALKNQNEALNNQNETLNIQTEAMNNHIENWNNQLETASRSTAAIAEYTTKLTKWFQSVQIMYGERVNGDGDGPGGLPMEAMGEED